MTQITSGKKAKINIEKEIEILESRLTILRSSLNSIGDECTHPETYNTPYFAGWPESMADGIWMPAQPPESPKERCKYCEIVLRELPFPGLDYWDRMKR